MDPLIETLVELTQSISNWIWGAPMVILLFGTGILLTVLTGFVQLRNFGKATRMVLAGALGKAEREGEEEGDISPFKSNCLFRKRDNEEICRDDGSKQG